MKDLNTLIDGMDTLQTINMQKSLERINNDENRLKDLFDVALGEFARWPSRLEEAIVSNELDRARKIAHSYKGSSATIGAERAQRLFLEIETAAKNKDVAKLRELFTYLKPELEKAEETIKTYYK